MSTSLDTYAPISKLPFNMITMLLLYIVQPGKGYVNLTNSSEKIPALWKFLEGPFIEFLDIKVESKASVSPFSDFVVHRFLLKRHHCKNQYNILFFVTLYYLKIV